MRCFAVVREMLRATKVPEALETICTDGIKGAMLMTRDGALLGLAGEGMEGVRDQALGAIASSVWEDLAKAAEHGVERVPGQPQEHGRRPRGGGRPHSRANQLYNT